MFQHGSYLAGRVAARQALDSGWTAEIAWTRVHAILHQRTCCKKGINVVDRTTYLAPRGNPRSSRSSSNRKPWDDREHPICIGRPRLFAIMVTHAEESRSVDLHQTDAISRDGSTVWIAIQSLSDGHGEARSAPLCDDTGSIGFQSDGAKRSWKNSTIAVRSNRNRDVIEPRSRSLRGGIASSRSDGDRRTTGTTNVARPRRDRGLIVAKKVAIRKQNWSWNHHRFIAELKPRSMPTESPPRRHQTASTITSIAYDLWADFPL